MKKHIARSFLRAGGIIIVIGILGAWVPPSYADCNNSVFWGTYTGTIYFESGRIFNYPEFTIDPDVSNFSNSYLYVPKCGQSAERVGLDKDNDIRYDAILVRQPIRKLTLISHGVWNGDDSNFLNGWANLVIATFSNDFNRINILVHAIDNDLDQARGLGNGTFKRK